MKTHITYASNDNKTEIHAIEWKPEKPPIAILQIAHGMTEFVDRYDRFAQFLNKHNILVVGNDHLGHGQSIIDTNELGYFAKENGNQCVLEDMHTLYRKTKSLYPNIPYILMGHSMGSFLTRQYIEIYGNQLNGAIIMGTGQTLLPVIKLAKAIASFLMKRKGDHYRSAFLTKLVLGNQNKAFEPSTTGLDWLTKDQSVIESYINNPLNTFIFTANAYYHMFKGMEYCQTHVQDVPQDLPILVISGDKDPVGDFGKGPTKVYKAYKQAGLQDVSLQLYQNDRHEILNELDYKQVQNDILQWIQIHI